MIADTFGDGWGSAKFFVEDNFGLHKLMAPTCHDNPMALEYCFDVNPSKQGDTLSASVYGFDADFPWEVRVLLRH